MTVVVLTLPLALAISVWICTLTTRRTASSAGYGIGIKIFTREEIERAVIQDRIGCGGCGSISKGILPDNTTVAIKRIYITGKDKVKDFVDKITVLGRVNHRNVVKLLGYCLELEELLLVYEYVPNGSLSYHIQNSSLNWEIRLKIAAETASALSYLHSLSPTSVIHGDVKSCNVLLDHDYTAKVAGFDVEVHVPSLMTGTFGYLDPEYVETQTLTEKSDVYSFGVILAELLTGMQPCTSSLEGEEGLLAKRFSTRMEANMLDQILDSTIVEESTMTQIKKVALHAMQCLSMKGEDRPRMMEVATELNGLREDGNDP